jgi:hypothetical protein
MEQWRVVDAINRTLPLSSDLLVVQPGFSLRVFGIMTFTQSGQDENS